MGEELTLHSEEIQAKLCPHGNNPVECNACKLSLEEAQKQANTLRDIAGQSPFRDKAFGRPKFSSTKDEYDLAQAKYEGMKQFGESGHLHDILRKHEKHGSWTAGSQVSHEGYKVTLPKLLEEEKKLMIKLDQGDQSFDTETRLQDVRDHISQIQRELSLGKHD